MMELPKITIVTPVYNGAEYIEKTIQSVLNQNYPNLEYMIIDGGSTDGTVDIIKKYSEKLAYWVSEKDNGIYSAIQKGFDRATGDIMGWINSDDYYSPYCFEIISKVFTQFNQVEWLTGLTTTYNESDWIIDAYNSREFTRLDFLSGNYQWVQQESTFWKKSLWDKAGAKLGNYMLADDFELWLRFSRYTNLYCINSWLSGFRQRSKNQLSLEGINKYFDECNDAIDKEPKTKEEIKAVRSIKKLENFEKFLRKTKIFNINIASRFIRKIKNRNNINLTIRFDRTKQEYYL